MPPPGSPARRSTPKAASSDHRTGVLNTERTEAAQSAQSRDESDERRRFEPQRHKGHKGRRGLVRKLLTLPPLLCDLGVLAVLIVFSRPSSVGTVQPICYLCSVRSFPLRRVVYW